MHPVRQNDSTKARGKSSAASGKSAPPPEKKERSDRTPKPAARRPPADEEDGPAQPSGSRFKKAKQDSKVLMFYGSGGLVLLIIILLIAKGGDLFGETPPPPKRIVIDDQARLDGIKKEGGDAFRLYVSADHASGGDKLKIINDAIAMNRDAFQKAGDMSQEDRYKGDEYGPQFACGSTHIFLYRLPSCNRGGATTLSEV